MSLERTAFLGERWSIRWTATIPLVVTIALAATGCATDPGVVTGSTPSEPDCPRSIEALQGSAKRMAELVPRIKTESAAVPSTVVGVFGRLAGKPGDGTQTYGDFERERLRGETALAKAKANGCPIADAEKQFEAAKAELTAFRG